MSADLDDMIRAAEAALGIEIVRRGDRAYHYAPETGSWYSLTREDLAYATDVVEEYPSDAYSHWCASTGQELTAARAARLGLGDAS